MHHEVVVVHAEPFRDDGEVTSRVCAQVARDLKDGLASLGVTLKPRHPLQQMISDAEWLAGLGEDLFVALSSLPPSQHEKAEVAMLRMEQAARIAEALAMAPRIRNAETIAVWLTGPLDRLRLDELNVRGEKRRKNDDDEALDHLLELEVAGRLARAGLNVGFEEPDILVCLESDTDKGRFGIAVKRPKRLTAIPSAMRKSASQIKRSGEHGVILVGVEAFFHAPQKAGTLFRMMHARTREEGETEGKRIIAEVTDKCAAEVERHLKKGAQIPIVICFGSFIYALDGVGYSNCMMAKTITNKSYRHAGVLSDLLQAVLTRKL